MSKTTAFIFLTTTVLLILLLERIIVTTVTKNPKGKKWVRRVKLFHPNSISLIRIPMGLVSIIMWHHGLLMTSFLWFAFWMITDLSDGTIARNCDLSTETGKWLDPFSDKCMYFPALLYFAIISPQPIPSIHTPLLPIYWIIALITIDTVGQFSRLFTKKTAANYFGKAKTALITILITVLAIRCICQVDFLPTHLFSILTISCTILAFLSFYCKIVPDIWYANSVTLANFTCGIAAIYQICHHEYMKALLLVFMGQFFDLFDGRLARKFGSTRFGALFDDIADGTNFGLAISVLIFYRLKTNLTPTISATIATIYMLCIIYRLYRFLSKTSNYPKGVFRGLPSPAGAMFAGTVALLLCPNYPIIGIILIIINAILMISTIPYKHFGQVLWPSLPRTFKVLFFVCFLIFVNISLSFKEYRDAFTIFCLVMITSYIIYAIDYKYIKKQRQTQLK